MNPLIMIIDDNLMFCARLTNTLKAVGYGPLVVGTLEKAVATIETTPPAAILINLASPHLDGVKVAEALRAHPASSAVPQIGYAGHKEREIRAAATAAGIDRITSNSEITFKLPDILRQLLPAGPRATID